MAANGLRGAVLTSAILVAGGGAVPTAAAQTADEFRVETRLFRDDDEEPFVHALTLFRDAVAYDFQLQGPESIAVFDFARENVVVLDPATQRRARVEFRELADFCREWAAAAPLDKRPFFQPGLQEVAGAEAGELLFRNEALAYLCRPAEGVRPEWVGRYYAFADWTVRLGAYRPGGAPPFARLELDAALAARGVLPREIELQLASTSVLSPRKLTIRSRHAFAGGFSAADRKRIERVGAEMLTPFEAVPYRELIATAPAAPKR